MIKLKIISCPVELTEARQKELTEEYKKSGKSVWKKKYITDALLEMSNEKCSYCECKVNVGGSYMEVEHFHPKDQYKDEVVAWENLLPSCKRCNISKGTHDTKAEPIIHPVRDNPKDHLYMKNYRLYSYKQSEVGQKAIEVLSLNDRNKKKLLFKRCEIGTKILEDMEHLFQDVPEYDKAAEKKIPKKNRLVNTFKYVLQQGTPESEYSAAAATIIVHDSEYPEIKKLFQKNDLWDKDFKELEKQVKSCAFKKP